MKPLFQHTEIDKCVCVCVLESACFDAAPDIIKIQPRNIYQPDVNRGLLTINRF